MTPLPLDLPSTARRLPRRSRSGGGQVVALGDASPAARGLARAAMALDSTACAGVITSSLHSRGAVATWDEVLLPVLHGVGDRWRATGRGIEVEHLLSECVEDGLRAVTRALARPLNARPVLLAALEPEAHRLALHALAAALAERQVGVRMLGPNLPPAALAAAAARTGPAVVFLWAQGTAAPSSRPAPGRGGRPAGARQAGRAQLAALPPTRPGSTLLLGGPGWPDHPGLPPSAQILKDLTSAVDAVTAAVGLDGSPPR